MLIVSQYDVEDTRRAQRQATPEGVQRFKEAAYGLSVHWGLYSLSESGTEWIYFNDRIPWAAYRQRLNQFNPTAIQRRGLGRPDGGGGPKIYAAHCQTS